MENSISLWSKYHFYTIYSLQKKWDIDRKWACFSFRAPGPSCHLQSVKHFLGPKNQEIRNFFLKNQEVIRNFLALKVTISYKIISKWQPSTPLRKSCLQHCNIFPICKLFQLWFGDVTFFPWVMCKWKKTKGRNQLKYSHLVNILKNPIPTWPTF